MAARNRRFFCWLFVSAGLVSSLWGTSVAADPGVDSCGVGTTGNVDITGIVDLTDLSLLVSYLTVAGQTLPCPDEANINAVGIIDVSDLSLLIAYLTTSGVVLPQCLNAIPLMSSAERAAELADAKQVIEANQDLPNVQFFDAILAYFQGNPNYEAYGYDSVYVCAWARFTDGVSFIVTRSLGYSPDTLAGEAFPAPILPEEPRTPELPATRMPSASSFSPPLAPMADPMELPGSLNVRILQAIGNGYRAVPVTTNRLISWFTQKNYSISSTSSNVTTLKTVAGDGFLYYMGHGVACYPRTGGKDYALLTTTPAATEAQVSGFQNDIATGRLCIIGGPVDFTAGGREIWDLRFGITTKFITTYWGDFADHAAVFINACASDSSAAFKAAIQAKNGPAYFGWSRTVISLDACDNAEFMVDRMLGVNKHWRKETPAQRPFDVTAVFNDLKSRNMHIRTVNDSGVIFQTRFNYTPGTGNFGILAPSIRFMAILEHQDSLEMNGIFGSDPGSRGKLIIGGTELPIGLWSEGLIQAFIPNTGAGSVGPVTVEIDGRVSNVVNLTEWNGLITYHKYDAGSLKAKMEIHLHLRADVHQFRDAPGQPPHTYTLYIAAAEDSYGQCFAEGTYTYHIPDSDPPDSVKYDWSQSVYLPGLWEQNPAGFFFQGQLDPVAKTWKPQFAAVSDAGLKEEVFWNSGTDINFFNLAFYSGLYDEQLFMRLHFSFDAQWNLNGRFRQENEDCCSRNPDLPEIWHDYVWPNMTASFSPDPNAAQ